MRRLYDVWSNDVWSNDGWFKDGLLYDGWLNDVWSNDDCFNDGLSTSEPDEVEAPLLNDCNFNWLNIGELFIISFLRSGLKLD